VTDTTTPSLPLTLEELHCLLPDPPSDTAVTAAAAALTRISDEIATTTAQLAGLDTADQAASVAVATAAGKSGVEFVKALGKTNPGDRPLLQYRLALLNRSWAVAHSRHADAENADPAHLAWRAHCQEVTTEWRRAMTLDDEAARFAALVDLTRRIG
jgi:hypothetical protein